MQKASLRLTDNYALCIVTGMVISGKSIRAARNGLKETQETFGARFGVDQSTVQRWESKGPPDRGAAKFALVKFMEEVGSAAPAEAAPQSETA